VAGKGGFLPYFGPVLFRRVANLASGRLVG